MKYNEAESLLDDALQRFVDFTGTSFEGRIYLLGRSDLKNKRKELFDITGATSEAFGDTYGSRQLYGYTLFDEFIAESMANLIKKYRVRIMSQNKVSL